MESMIKKIKLNMITKATLIHIGLNTHNHVQVIISTNFNIINAIVNIPAKPMLPLKIYTSF